MVFLGSGLWLCSVDLVPLTSPPVEILVQPAGIVGAYSEGIHNFTAALAARWQLYGFSCISVYLSNAFATSTAITSLPAIVEVCTSMALPKEEQLLMTTMKFTGALFLLVQLTPVVAGGIVVNSLAQVTMASMLGHSLFDLTFGS